MLQSIGLLVSSIAALATPATAADDIAALKVSVPHVQENLAIYFIHGKSQPGPVPLTLAEAMRARTVTVHETGNVEQLLIENTGDKEVFVQAGDIVKGGRQDRVLTISLLLPPKSGKISIGAYCVEQGRWSRRGVESEQRFSSADSAMPSRAAKIAILSAKPRAVPLRHRTPILGALLNTAPGNERLSGERLAAQSRILRDLEQRRSQLGTEQRVYRRAERLRETTGREASRQQEVWRNVAEIQRKLSTNLAAGVRSKMSASSLQLSLEHQKLVEAREKMAAALLPLGTKAKDIIGYAFAINGRINSAEIYPSNGLFRKMWPKLLKASVTEAIAEKDAAEAGSKAPEQAAIKAFLDDAKKGKSDTSPLHAKLKRERRESDKALSLATRRGDGRVVHHSVLAR